MKGQIKMYKNMVFHKTPYGTIRVWVYFYEKCPIITIQRIFDFLSIWGGEDKNYLENECRVMSWEMKESLTDWIKEKFQHNPDVDISGLG